MESPPTLAAPPAPRKPFRWQIIPATLQIFFGGMLGVATVPMSLRIWNSHQLTKGLEESDWVGTSLEHYAAADTPYWCAYAFIGVGLTSALFLFGAHYWLRRRNRMALLLSAAAVAFYSSTAWWLSSRFPDM